MQVVVGLINSLAMFLGAEDGVDLGIGHGEGLVQRVLHSVLHFEAVKEAERVGAGLRVRKSSIPVNSKLSVSSNHHSRAQFNSYNVVSHPHKIKTNSS